MPLFSAKSKAILSTCHPDIQRVCHAVINVYDFTVLQGHRSEEEHRQLVLAGRSKVAYSESKHRLSPSHAVDIAPYPINWQDRERFFYLAGAMHMIATQYGITLRWGGDWDQDRNFTDQTFDDLVHFELA